MCKYIKCLEVKIYTTMKNFIRSLCLIRILLTWTNAQNVTGPNFGVCQTPNNENGTCIYLSACTTLYSILETGKVTDAERTFLRSSQCGFHENQYLVCCPELLPQVPNCPVPLNIRIVGGYNTEIDEFPWLVRIEYTKTDYSTGFYCGGSLINDRYVLTAAHCVKGKVPRGWTPTSVRLGEWDTTTNRDCVLGIRDKMDCADPHVDVGIQEIISHPDYEPLSRNQQHDIALVRLEKSVKMSAFIKPICLPEKNDSRVAQSQLMETAGWGITEISDYTNVKKSTKLSIWDATECQNKFEVRNVTLIESQMCAGGEKSKDTCVGDSGGSLFYTHAHDHQYFMLAGIASLRSRNCDERGWPTIYTRVDKYLNWIKATLKP